MLSPLPESLAFARYAALAWAERCAQRLCGTHKTVKRD